jgi:hypothetical protein
MKGAEVFWDPVRSCLSRLIISNGLSLKMNSFTFISLSFFQFKFYQIIGGFAKMESPVRKVIIQDEFVCWVIGKEFFVLNPAIELLELDIVHKYFRIDKILA